MLTAQNLLLIFIRQCLDGRIAVLFHEVVGVILEVTVCQDEGGRRQSVNQLLKVGPRVRSLLLGEKSLLRFSVYLMEEVIDNFHLVEQEGGRHCYGWNNYGKKLDALLV